MLYQIIIADRRTVPQEFLQPTQATAAHPGCLRRSHCATHGAIEHPLWHFRRPGVIVIGEMALKYTTISPHHRLINDHLLAEPRVPWINYLRLGTMGFLLSSCITNIAPIRRFGVRHPRRSTCTSGRRIDALGWNLVSSGLGLPPAPCPRCWSRASLACRSSWR